MATEIVYGTTSALYGYMTPALSIGPPPSGTTSINNIAGANRTGTAHLAGISKTQTWTSYRIFVSWSGGYVQRGTNVGSSSIILRYSNNFGASAIVITSWTRTAINGTDTIAAGSAWSSVVTGDPLINQFSLQVYGSVTRGNASITITNFYIEGTYDAGDAGGKKSACASS